MKLLLSEEKEKQLEKSVEQRLKFAQMIEPDVTKVLFELSGKYGFKLVSLDCKLKTKDSAVRKAKKIIFDTYGESPTDSDVSIPEVVGSIEDYLRYTAILDEESFSENVRKIIDDLKNASYKITKLNNRFQNQTYKDIISWYTSENIVTLEYAFELQFHTQASYDAKLINHYIYEITRKYEIELNKVDDEIIKLLDKALKALYAKVSVPKNVEKIDNI